MTSRRTVPRADGEGGVGTALKKLGSGYFYTINSTTANITTANVTNVSGFTATGGINETSVTLASASTMNIGAAAGNLINVTGTTTITAFDTVQAGTKRTLIFGSALTVTYNATTLILPNAASITVAAGDSMIFVSLGSGNWKCVSYLSTSTVATGSQFGTVKIGSGIAVSAGVISSAITILNETQTSGTAGGTFTSGAWRTRTLNTTVIDQIGITLSSNQFTLPAGTYEITASAPAFAVANHKSRLQNITDSTTTLLGNTAYTPITNASISHSIINTVFTITAAKVFEIQHICNSTFATSGFGIASSFSVNEIYTIVTIRKVG